MDFLKSALGAVARLLGHGDAPLPVSLPLGAWSVATLSDGLALTTGHDIYDAAARYAIGVGLAGTAGAMVTGLIERKSEGVTAERHPAGIAAHATGGLLVGGLYIASLALRVRAHEAGHRASPIARGLALAGCGMAVANAVMTHRLANEPKGRARLDPASPLGLHTA